ncbi:MAG: spore coat protein CotJB [Marvinbryantia sp.]|uniref:spore coat protein CotJB n=1 Tax=Marvinbryantia sp. TaxID=2496532 RepID=UPI003999EB2E
MSNYMMRNNPSPVQRSCTRECQQPMPMPRQAGEGCRISCPSSPENRQAAGSPRDYRMESRRMPFETMSQMQLLNCINEVSFAVDDILLYLDTHPDDCAALAYSREMIATRREAMAVYARRFAPLTIDCTNDTESCRWEWVMQPWPWEPMTKGGCR